jgi:hypothetical protein
MKAPCSCRCHQHTVWNDWSIQASGPRCCRQAVATLSAVLRCCNPRQHRRIGVLQVCLSRAKCVAWTALFTRCRLCFLSDRYSSNAANSRHLAKGTAASSSRSPCQVLASHPGCRCTATACDVSSMLSQSAKTCTSSCKTQGIAVCMPAELSEHLLLGHKYGYNSSAAPFRQEVEPRLAVRQAAANVVVTEGAAGCIAAPGPVLRHRVVQQRLHIVTSQNGKPGLSHAQWSRMPADTGASTAGKHAACAPAERSSGVQSLCDDVFVHIISAKCRMIVLGGSHAGEGVDGK